ncbi:unnamed protein product [Closterium sp. NIES-65]|nr:unnamed protein product [Closterium sp. NIES-65]
MARWIDNAGPAGVPLTLQTIRNHVAIMARNMGIPPVFRCSIGWVRRALRRTGVRCRAATGEAASADMAAVREAREKVPALLTHLGYQPRDTFNLDETALWLSVLPQKTYSNARIPGRKVSKERLTVAFLVNDDGSHVFRPLVISKARHPHDFRPDYDPEALFTNFISQLNAAMYAEGREIAVLLDNASSHMLRDECAWSEIVCGMRTTRLSNVRLIFLPPNTTAFTQPLDQGIIATAKARYRQHWLRAFMALWNDDGATSAVARYRPNLRDVLGWLSDAWMSVGARTIQRCFWRTGCIDEGEPTCAEAAAGATPDDADVGLVAELWRAPTTMQAVYDESDPIGREARRTAWAASEMLIGYARAVSVTPRDLCHLFDIRNPIIRERMERASPALNLNTAPPPRLSPTLIPPPDTPRPRGRVLPGWITQPSRRQQFLDAGVGAAMGGYVEAAEWMHAPDLPLSRSRLTFSIHKKIATSLYFSVVALIIAIWAVFIFRAIQAPPPIPLTDADVTSPRVRLSDGRHVAYHEMGAAADVAKYQVLVVHAWQTCRLSMLPNITQEFLEANGIRLVSYDRAGYGQSDPNPGRTLQSDVRDAAEVATLVGLGEKFYLVATSMGTYVALGALRYIPHRLKGLTIISVVGNLWDPTWPKHEFTATWQQMPVQDRITLLLARHVPSLLHVWFSQTVVPMGNFRHPFHPHPVELYESDMAALASTEVFGYFAQNMQEGARQGAGVSWYRDFEILASDWGFNLSEIDLSQTREEGKNGGEDGGEEGGLKGKVHIWHAEEDWGARVGYARHVGRMVDGSVLHVVPKRGHFFMYNDAHMPPTVLLTMLGLEGKVKAEDVGMPSACSAGFGMLIHVRYALVRSYSTCPLVALVPA